MLLRRAVSAGSGGITGVEGPAGFQVEYMNLPLGSRTMLNARRDDKELAGPERHRPTGEVDMQRAFKDKKRDHPTSRACAR